MFYLVGISIQQDKLVAFIRDDKDGSIEAINKGDLKFALKNGVEIEGASIIDGKELFEPTYFEKDVCLLTEDETSAIKKICAVEQVALEPTIADYSHFKDSNTGELLTITEGLRKLDQQRQVNGFGIENYNLTSEETDCINKLSIKYGVGLNTSNSADTSMLNGLGEISSLDTLDGLDTNTDEYGLSMEKQPDPVDAVEDEPEDNAEPEEEETIVSKLYDKLDTEQNGILSRYYLWYSRRVFKLAGINGQNTNITRNTVRMKNKRKNIELLKDAYDIDDTNLPEYLGFIDAGIKGVKRCKEGHIIAPDKDMCNHGHPLYFEARCTFKHKLRFMHIACSAKKVPTDLAFYGEHYNKRVEDILSENKDKFIIFGISCIGDFFNVDSSYINLLQTTQRRTLKDMEQMYSYYEANNVQEVLDSFTVLDDFMQYVQKYVATRSLLGTPSIVDAGTTQFYLQCRKAGLIPPKSLVQMVRDTIIGWDIDSVKGHKFNGTLGHINKDFFLTVMNHIFHAKYNDLIELALGDCGSFRYASSNQVFPTAYTEANSSYLIELRDYFNIYFKYEICGDFYKYRANSESKDEGGTSAIVRKELKKAYTCIDTLWKDLEFSIDYLSKINTFYKVRAELDLNDVLSTVYQLNYDIDTNRYKIDFNETRIDYELIQGYSSEKDSQLGDAVAKLYNGHRGRINGMYSYSSYFKYNQFTIDEAIQLVKQAIDIVKNEQSEYNAWVLQHLTEQCEEKNTVLEIQEERNKNEEEIRERETQAKALATEQEKANRLAELRAKDAKKLSSAELVEVLQNSDISSLETWQQGILNTAISWRDKSKLSSKQVYHLQRMFNQLYHPDAVQQTNTTNAVVELKDDQRMKDALEYARANKADFIGQKGIDSFALDQIAVSVLVRGRYSEKQKKYIAPILSRYEELGK